jgi:diacylglycerol kinase family enzyme
MKLIVIHNPDAGAGAWDARQVDRLLRAAGHTPHIESSKKKWRSLFDEEADAFVAVGGDGTVHKVLQGMKGRNIPVAILPTGTANNVAHGLGYDATEDLGRRVARWPDNERILMLALVEMRGERRYFIESVGVGVFAKMVRTPYTRKTKPPADIALTDFRQHLAGLLRNAKPMVVTANVGGKTIVDEYLLLECLNLPFYGPRLPFAPEQSSETQTVTVCGVRADSREATAEWIIRGEGDPGIHIIGVAPYVEIAAKGVVHVDGKPWPDKRVRQRQLRIRAAAITVRVWV